MHQEGENVGRATLTHILARQFRPYTTYLFLQLPIFIVKVAKVAKSNPYF